MSAAPASTRYVVGPVSELPPGSVKVVHPKEGDVGIGVFNVDGQFYALRNYCPHYGAPLCRGAINGTSEPVSRPSGEFEPHWIREGEIITCPWHHWEFEIRTGRTIFKSKFRSRSYEVLVEQDPETAERLRKGAETVPVEVDDANIVLVLD